MQFTANISAPGPILNKTEQNEISRKYYTLTRLVDSSNSLRAPRGRDSLVSRCRGYNCLYAPIRMDVVEVYKELDMNLNFRDSKLISDSEETGGPSHKAFKVYSSIRDV